MLRTRIHEYARLTLVVPILLLWLPGCTFRGATVLEEKPFPMQSIVVAGFMPVLSGNEEPGVVRGPLYGAMYQAHPIRQDVAEKMTDSLFRKVAQKGYQVIPPGQAEGVLASLLSSRPDMKGIEIYREVGTSLSADGVLVGYLYRWLEREGTELAVDRPASVAFDLYLLRSQDGTMVWRGKFDKTQQSFSENLLDFQAFLRSRARWVSAETLAEMGLDELLRKFPASMGGSEKE